MKHNTDISDRYQFDLVRFVFRRLGITFSKATVAKLVGGEYRLEKLV